jgi:antirestriction protein ArdC
MATRSLLALFPQFDFIQVPPSIAFTSAVEEASTRLHELAHATGHESRLQRDMSGGFGSKTYAFEELVAETASAFLGLQLNLPCDIPNHANYVSHWLGILKEDKKAMYRSFRPLWGATVKAISRMISAIMLDGIAAATSGSIALSRVSTIMSTPRSK